MFFGSIAVILALSCGFDEIFAAIGFNKIGVPWDGEVVCPPEVVDVDALGDGEGDFRPDVVDVERDVAPVEGLPAVVGLPVVLDACTRCGAPADRPFASA